MDQEIFQMEFVGGPCDGGTFDMPKTHADIGYKIKWVIKVKADGTTHTYESVVELEDNTGTMEMAYIGAVNYAGWTPGEMGEQ